MAARGDQLDLRIRVRDDGSVVIRNFADQADRSFKKTGDSARGLSGVIERSARTLGSSLLVAGLAVSGFVGLTAKAAIDYETSWTGVLKTVNGTREQLQGLQVDLRDMSREIPTSANELNHIAESAGQLGIKTPQVASFTRTIADLGQTTNLASNEGATMLARFANITGLAQQANPAWDRLGSTIVDLGNNFATTEREIVEMGLRLAGSGRIIGLSEAQTLGLATALSSVGIEAEAGGTALSRVMSEMANSVHTGGARLQAFAKIAGTTAEDFAKSFRENAAQALLSFIGGLNQIHESGGNAFAALESVEFGNIRVRDALLRAAGAQDLMKRALALSDRAWDSNNALTDEARKRYETTASKVQTLRNKINDLRTDLGQKLEPAMKSATSGLGAVVDELDEASDGTKAVVVGLSSIVGYLSLTAGAALLALPRIVATRIAIAELGGAAVIAAGAIGVTGLGLLIAFAGLVAVKMIEAKRSMREAAEEAERLREKTANLSFDSQILTGRLIALGRDGFAEWLRAAKPGPEQLAAWGQGLQELARKNPEMRDRINEVAQALRDYVSETANASRGSRTLGNDVGDAGQKFDELFERMDLVKRTDLDKRFADLQTAVRNQLVPMEQLVPIWNDLQQEYKDAGYWSAEVNTQFQRLGIEILRHGGTLIPKLKQSTAEATGAIKQHRDALVEADEVYVVNGVNLNQLIANITGLDEVVVRAVMSRRDLTQEEKNWALVLRSQGIPATWEVTTALAQMFAIIQAGQAKDPVSFMLALADAMQRLHEAQFGSGDGDSKGFGATFVSNLIQELQRVSNALGEAIIRGEFDDAGKQIGAAIGSAAGAAIGTTLGGPAGRAVGNILGSILGDALGKALAGLFGERDSVEKRTQQAVRNLRFLGNVSEQVARQVGEIAFQYRKLANLHGIDPNAVANLLALGEILRDTGIPGSSALATTINILTSGLAMVGRGVITDRQLLDAWADALPEIIDNLDILDERSREAWRSFIEGARASGLEVDALNAHVTDVLNNIVGSVNTLLDQVQRNLDRSDREVENAMIALFRQGITAALTDVKDRDQAIADLSKALGVDLSQALADGFLSAPEVRQLFGGDLGLLGDALKYLSRLTGLHLQDPRPQDTHEGDMFAQGIGGNPRSLRNFDLAGQAIALSIQEALAQGMGIDEIKQVFGPTIERMADIADALGVDLPPELARMNYLLEFLGQHRIARLNDEIRALGSIMDNLLQIGLKPLPGMFDQFQKDVKRAVKALLESGGTQEDVLLAFGPQIMSVLTLARDFDLKLNRTTRSIFEQAGIDVESILRQTSERDLTERGWDDARDHWRFMESAARWQVRYLERIAQRLLGPGMATGGVVQGPATVFIEPGIHEAFVPLSGPHVRRGVPMGTGGDTPQAVRLDIHVLGDGPAAAFLRETLDSDNVQISATRRDG